MSGALSGKAAGEAGTSFPRRHKPRFVSPVKVKNTFQPAVLHDCPASAHRWVHFVVSIPGKINGRFVATHRNAVADVAVNVAEME
ncbi:hypothetical protein Pla8534_14840 [Lignipirellula cremea]|uniref:Uncharacterized protein n=1 Tax=Lignipirellula cremea TaxID=2528010 RepID=A0A518DPG9_9BACT|nr:hypothetical protein Pla8534_14840 [Lignipirellula cremea]